MVGSVQASHVLLAMGVPKNTALATVRFSLGSQTTPGDVQRAASAVRSVVELQTHSASCDTNSFS
jgi:cysteine desulfurase